MWAESPGHWEAQVLVTDPPLGVTAGKSQTLRVSVSSFVKLGLKKKKASDTY